jgi:hypothetical protein
VVGWSDRLRSNGRATIRPSRETGVEKNGCTAVSGGSSWIQFTEVRQCWRECSPGCCDSPCDAWWVAGETAMVGLDEAPVGVQPRVCPARLYCTLVSRRTTVIARRYQLIVPLIVIFVV